MVAKDDYKIIGIACCSEDSETMYQIGVDVSSEYRGQSVGKTSVSNLKSRNLAISLGYYPVWIDFYTR